ncbi:hypothetical protein [Bremerella cremea]|uniref:hypothetical protein n=1 Tax=Bremerella cremea TaxID=1031537 RepID=UPI0031EA8F7C
MVGAYFNRLCESVTNGWDRFWFRPDSPQTVSVVRIVVGAVALIYALSFTSELAIWFSDGGVLPIDRTYRLTGADDPSAAVRYWSLFYLAHTPLHLYVLHAIGLLSIVAFLTGFQTRISTIVATIFVLSYAERAPMLTGLIEPLLCPVMLYLCLAPCGAYYSVDAWLRRRKGDTQPIALSYAANIAIRLIQIHVSAFYLMMGLSKLGGMVWWNGEAMWWMIAQPDTRLIDLTFLRDKNLRLFVFGWTHLVVFFELAFGLLIWFKIWRPLLTVLATLHWLGLGLVTGHWEFAILMIGLSLAFAPWEVLTPATEPDEATAKTQSTPKPAQAGV